jgi:hypothetical protein
MGWCNPGWLADGHGCLQLAVKDEPSILIGLAFAQRADRARCEPPEQRHRASRVLPFVVELLDAALPEGSEGRMRDR